MVDDKIRAMSEPHSFFMLRALELARAHLGQAWPNPAVGAVIVKDGIIIGEAATAKGGRPHAETIALGQAGTQAKGATLYVTLEPCSHHGKTPPCADAIIKAGISECVIACRDPHQAVNGTGVERLKAAGIHITEGIGKEEAQETHRGFFSIIHKKRPFIALKMATSRDGKIAAYAGQRTDITGGPARLHGQALRAEFDAILTGIGTVLADDPLLTVRIPGMEHRSPVRIVLDSHNRLPAHSHLRQTEKQVPVWVYTRNHDVIAELTERGITRLLIEGGQGINTHFLQSGLVDRIYWYQAPHTLGPDALDAMAGGLCLDGWQPVGDVIKLGADHCIILEKAS